MKIEVERATYERYAKVRDELKTKGLVANNDDMINMLLSEYGYKRH